MRAILRGFGAAAILFGILTGASLGQAYSAAMSKTTTASGLVIEELTIGTGAEAKAGSKVTVHYTGWLLYGGEKGRKFDSSRDRSDPFGFPLGGGKVIKGWDEGVQGMKVGGNRRLTIPPELGYGEAGSPPDIAPNETLIFVIDLLDVG